MCDTSTAELIVTVEGTAKNIVFAEELIANAPKLAGWKFTALKPALNIEDISIDMHGYKFDVSNIWFYSNDLPEYPDEIDIAIVYENLNSKNRDKLTSGIYIFLDNYLGELDFATNVDNLKIVEKNDATNELIPISKLKDFLIWRQKEFVEKYEGLRYDTENDEHSILEAELKGGNMLVAVVNTELLEWDQKASHPWISAITVKYDGSKTNGMPDSKDYNALNEIEDLFARQLVDKDGYLNIGRQTAKNEREIYFACKDFRKPSKVFDEIQKLYAGKFEMELDTYKDKYWRSFERFNRRKETD